ncbi:TonB-dependent receptor [Dyadobacter aurulentus]|uniref:TonB-dependent receptor n=1 Tax=Dyadobacter sp. UC 10 TaxID=2605428 RepID=UPI0011F38B2E|nr:TonB-dependent receptor [Dyadobacter sp. UC 10]KAA0992034.1 TonB-dependent receptor [Dyadobacter sp. UC 10]
MLRFLPLLFFVFTTGFAQTYTSTIRGTVRDADTGSPLVGATVQLVQGQTGTITGPDGTFRFDKLAVGRYQATVTYVGYETINIPEILLESGKENIIQVKLSPAGRQLQEATVSAARPVAFNSVQPITMEQTFRYAATYMDPARVATSFPGVAAANDQANGLVIRGNSPNSMQWRLEGVEIVNPNHLSNAGTFSDRPTSTGGGVNILSTQLLATSSFLAGPFPAQYGNVNGGVLDMNLRKGNDEQTEFTAQASLLGFDVAAEGPFSKKSKASYLVNYRYSFTGLLGAMGVSFGGEDINFQDLSFNLNFPTAKGGKFTVFGMGGLSDNTLKPDKDTTTWEFYKDGQHIVYRGKMGAAGLTFDQPIGNRASIRTVIAGSGLHSTRKAFLVDPKTLLNDEVLGDDQISSSKISFNTTFNYRFNAKQRLKAGIFLTSQQFGTPPNFFDEKINAWIVQPFVNWSYQIAPAVTTEIGLHAMISKLREEDAKGSFLLEPRAALKWQVADNQQLSLSYGLHSQLQSPNVYAATYGMTTIRRNMHLKPTRSHHLVLGYQQTFNKSNSLKVEAYLQNQFDVPVGEDLGTQYSALNLIEERPEVHFQNKGKGLTYGLEASFQKFLTNDFYMLASGSIYDATYLDLNGNRGASRFGGRHTFSLTAGKELKSGDANIWGINAKILWIGGFRDRPVDEEYSRTLKFTIYSNSGLYSVKMKDYFRPDLRIYWKKSKTKYSRTLALDLQNVSGTKNEAYRYFDIRQDKVVTQYQLGLIPVLSYRWEF